MKRMIELLDRKFEVTVFAESGATHLQVDGGEPEIADMTCMETGIRRIRYGEHTAPVEVVTRGEFVFIRAFDRTFSLRIVDPVEQAEQESGGRGKTARAPMPGTVVEVRVKEGERVQKGQPVMVIESMKILTVIPAPRNGEVKQIHFAPGGTFDKNAVLITLADTLDEN